MPERTTTFRLYLLRALYLLNFAMLGLDVWPDLLSKGGAWDPMTGVAFAFWGALSVVSILGLRYPVGMIPLLLLQFVYKLVWLFAVGLPQWDAVRSLELTSAMLVGLAIDLVVIPWPYVYRNYVKKPGARWRRSATT